MTNPLRSGSRWLSPLSIVAASLLLASCALGPDYRRPDVNVPAGYKEPQTNAPASPAIGADWWTLFNDPDLTRLATDTLAANLDIKVAIARVDQAHAVTQSAAGNFFPLISSS